MLEYSADNLAFYERAISGARLYLAPGSEQGTSAKDQRYHQKRKNNMRKGRRVHGKECCKPDEASRRLFMRDCPKHLKEYVPRGLNFSQFHNHVAHNRN